MKYRIKVVELSSGEIAHYPQIKNLFWFNLNNWGFVELQSAQRIIEEDKAMRARKKKVKTEYVYL